MRELERLMTYNSDAESVFAYVADLKHFPEYLPTVREVIKEDGDKIRMRGSAHGHDYDSEGYLHIDHPGMRMEWGAKDGHYKGWLTVRGGDATQTLAEVTVHLTFTQDSIRRGQTPDQFDEAMLDGMQKALDKIGHHVSRPAPAAF